MPNGTNNTSDGDKEGEPKYCTAQTFDGVCNSTLNSDDTCPAEHTHWPT
jgi:hypothetical protein